MKQLEYNPYSFDKDNVTTILFVDLKMDFFNGSKHFNFKTILLRH